MREREREREGGGRFQLLSHLFTSSQSLVNRPCLSEFKVVMMIETDSN